MAIALSTGKRPSTGIRANVFYQKGNESRGHLSMPAPCFVEAERADGQLFRKTKRNKSALVGIEDTDVGVHPRTKRQVGEVYEPNYKTNVLFLPEAETTQPPSSLRFATGRFAAFLTWEGVPASGRCWRAALSDASARQGDP